MLILNGFKNIILKDVKLVNREGKKPLCFVNLVDTDTHDHSGDIMFMSEDRDFNVYTLEALQGLKVKAKLTLSIYNNRPSLTVSKIEKL